MYLFSLGIIWLCLVTDGVLTGEVSEQIGYIKCLTDADTGIMTAMMKIEKKNTNSVRVFYIDDTIQEIPASVCAWTGDGTDENPFLSTIMIDSNTNEPPNGMASCGHVVVDAAKFTYKWTVYVQAESELSRPDDVMFTFQCSARQLLDELSTDVTLSIPPTVILNSRKDQLNFGFYLSSAGSLVNTASLLVGSIFNLGLEFEPDASANSDVAAWGAYCTELYVSPRADAEYRAFSLLDDNGCPTTSPILELGGPFTGVMPATVSTYRSRTGDIEVAKFDRSAIHPQEDSNKLYFFCVAELCFIQDDHKCINRCDGGARRRRRSVDTTFTVTANITIIDDQPPATPSGQGNVTFLVLASIGGFLLFLVFLVVLVFICWRRKTTKHYVRERDSAASVVNSKSSYLSKESLTMSDKGFAGYTKHPKY